MPLSTAKIKAAKPTGKTQRLFDERGLYLEVSPKGGKWWRLKYSFHSKEKRISLGVYPDVGLKEARERRDEARKLVANGINPSEHRKRSKATTLQAVGEEWFEKQKSGWAPNYASKVKGRLENDVYPYLGSTPIAEVSPQALLSALRRVESRGAIETAHRVRSASASCPPS